MSLLTLEEQTAAFHLGKQDGENGNTEWRDQCMPFMDQNHPTFKEKWEWYDKGLEVGKIENVKLQKVYEKWPKFINDLTDLCNRYNVDIKYDRMTGHSFCMDGYYLSDQVEIDHTEK